MSSEAIVGVHANDTALMQHITGSEAAAIRSWTICTAEDALFHEGPVRISKEHIFCTSNILQPTAQPPGSNTSGAKLQHQQPISRIELVNVNVRTGEVCVLRNHGIVMGNGATGDGKGNVLVCSQGYGRGTTAGLYHLNPWTCESTPLITTQPCSSEGRTFNSPNDVCATRDLRFVYMSDPSYAFKQGFREGKPDAPDAIWRIDLHEQRARPVDTSLVKPNGVQLSPDEATLYATDTGYFDGSAIDPSQPRCLHEFSVSSHASGELSHCKLFAHVSDGIPDGLKCDAEGNVYAGVGSGVYVWGPDGTYIGAFTVDGGVANFVFAGPRNNLLIMLNETRIVACELGVRGDLTNGIDTT